MSAVMRLTLAREEVLVLLQIAKLPGMFGLDTSLSPDCGEALFNLALRTLIARGLVGLHPDGSFSTDETLMAVIGACVGPDVIALITTHTPIQMFTTSFPIQLKPGLFVSHEAHQDIHTFEVYEDIRQVAEVAAKALRFTTEIQSAGSDPIRLQNSTIEAARAVKNDGEAAIYAVLQREGGDAAVLKRIAHTMARASYNGSFTLLKSILDRVDGFAVLASDTEIFLMTPDKAADSPWTTIQPTSTQEVRRRVHGACLTVL